MLQAFYYIAVSACTSTCGYISLTQNGSKYTGIQLQICYIVHPEYRQDMCCVSRGFFDLSVQGDTKCFEVK